MAKLTESDVEQATLYWLKGLGYTPLHSSEIAPDAPKEDYKFSSFLTNAEVFGLISFGLFAFLCLNYKRI